MVGEIAREPQHDCLMRTAIFDFFARTPGVGQVRAQKNEIVVAVRTDVVADVTLSEAVQRHRQFEFRVVVPFEREGLKAAMEYGPGAALVDEDFFEEGLHHDPAP